MTDVPRLSTCCRCWPLLLALATPATPAEPVSLPHGETTLLGELLTPAGAPGGSVVLIVHGTLASHRMELVEALQAALAGHDIASLAVSLDLGEPGRAGMRDCALAHRHRHEDAQAEIAAWTAWLRAGGFTDITLLGHSRGGNQAARFALDGSEPLRALVLVAPATHDAETEARDYRARSGEALDALLERARSVPGDTLLAGVPFLYCGPSRVSAASFLSYHGGGPERDTPSLLARIAVPTLVIAGSEDSTVPDVVEKTTPHLDEDTRLLVIEGADHFFRDFYAEDIGDAVAALLAGPDA